MTTDKKLIVLLKAIAEYGEINWNCAIESVNDDDINNINIRIVKTQQALLKIIELLCELKK